MFISASTIDEIVPFEGVEKYVTKLKQCIQTHRNHLPTHTRINHSDDDSVAHTTATGGGESGRGFSRYLKRELFFSSSSEVTRGCVVFHVDDKYGHFGSDNAEENLKEVCVYIVLWHSFHAHTNACMPIYMHVHLSIHTHALTFEYISQAAVRINFMNDVL